MTKPNLNSILLIVFSLLLFSVFFLLTQNRQNNSFAAIPDDITGKVDRIEISRPDDPLTLVLSKQNDTWFVMLDQEVFWPAKNLKVSDFLDDLAKRYPAKQVSSDSSFFGGSDESYPVIFRLQNSGLDVTPDIFCGTSTANGRYRYLKTGTTGITYRTEDFLWPYLDTRLKAWTEPELYAELLSENEIGELTVTFAYKKIRFLNDKDSPVENFSRKLEKLVCTDVTNLSVPALYTIKIITGNLETIEIGLSPLPDTAYLMTDSRYTGAFIVSKDSIGELLQTLGLSFLLN